MHNKIKVYSCYSNMIPIILFKEKFEIVKTVEESDMVVLPGGGDWYPYLYTHEIHHKSYYTKETDIAQLKLMKEAIENNKFLFGICRGAQGLCIAAGGSLFQDVTGHGGGAGGHSVYDYSKRKDFELNMSYDENKDLSFDKTSVFNVNSLHHQMLDLRGLEEDIDYEMLYYSICSTDISGLSSREMVTHLEPEIVYFNKLNALAIQGHPEMGSFGQIASKVLYNILIERLNQFNTLKNLSTASYTHTQYRLDNIEMISRIERLIRIAKTGEKATTVMPIFKRLARSADVPVETLSLDSGGFVKTTTTETIVSNKQKDDSLSMTELFKQII